MVQSISLTVRDHNSHGPSLKNNISKPHNFDKMIGKMQKDQQIVENDLKYSDILEQLDNLEQEFFNIEELFPKSPKIDPLKVLLTNIQDILKTVEDNIMVLDEEILMEWSQNMIDFVSQSLKEFSQKGELEDDIFFSANYLAFVVNNLDISFFQENDPKQNILLQMIQKANDVYTQNITLLSPLEESSISETFADNNELEFISGILEYEDKQHDEKSVFFVKDNRVEPQKIKEINDPLVLEALYENQIPVLGENTVELPSQSRLISSVQRAYENFSSPVSRVQVEAMMQNVAAKSFITLQEGNSEMKMKLTPPELGHMKLSFRIEDGIMSGKIVVGTQEARFFFEQNLDNLRQSLAEAGIMLAGVDVQLDGGAFQEQDELQDSTQYKAIRLGSGEQKNKVSNGLVLDTIVDYTV
ncbi:hook-length control protein FliK [Brevinema andersonii]|uniref:Hook-length control protein FliK n=1 Tax=Brevinema andersonii TaxID=34097 RepID=A0A1I1E589_BREAD|nr:flagellar hook-length control protein FliK [Brevinema andersonii]SFB80398.1 hook-length control protein FliK [Brevinema andersonii]